MDGADFSRDHTSERLRTYLASLQVEVTLSGSNTVTREWRDLNYLPNYSKFYFIEGGEGWLQVDGQDYYPMRGQLAFMPEGRRQSYSCTQGPTYTKQWCHFTARFGNTNLFDFLRVPVLIDVPEDERAWLRSQFATITSRRDSRDAVAPLHRNGALLQILAWFLGRVPVGLSADSDRFALCREHIENHLDQEIGLAELAELCHLQVEYFGRLFKKQMGVAPLQYVRLRRLEEARRLLSVPTLSLKEIAQRVGIDSPFYLSRLFKAHTGFSPQHYRDQLVLEAHSDQS